ncbi:cobalt-precorrin-6A reductase [Kribbella sp. ALI-6-A]|uniref:cobalt-precorrin-6A reductase n=1 Tax=Kribbella sp. ALI-6-A TaxID=1933817 RepID=UPI00097C30D0|nr:cobalt-precorrin-6A reductase [Kribbella sp. ALI-6-A]ONI72216.1 cobalt-precorrin-6A reductase [Kribbella sp. ALI-6-A]
MKVLLLGGTGEARRLADLLVAQDIDVVSSLAGRTTDARLPAGQVRQGGFGGVDGLVAWLRDEQVDALVDATHPFAATMTEHAAEAARRTGVALLVLRRPGWDGGHGSAWHWVESADAAARLLPQVGSRVFLTIGRQGLDAFAGTGLWTLARCVDPPEPEPDWCTVILARGPFAVEDEVRLLREHRIDVLVTKDSGGEMTSAKLEAARQLGVPVIVIGRPPLPSGVDAVESVDQVVEWLRRRR